MPLIRIAFKPGIDKQNTEYGAEGGYTDADMVRFRYGLPEKVGGWTKFAQLEANLVGMASDAFSWTSLSSVPFLAVGTNRKLYVFTGGAWYDITPIREVKVGVTFDTLAGSPDVIVNHSGGHGADAGDFVKFRAVSGSPGGLSDVLLASEFEIQEIISGTQYRILFPENAPSTAVAAGSATATYQINVGSDVSYFDFGYGIGGYGLSTYGTPRPAVGTLALSSRIWQFDNFGENLICQINNGPVYQWGPTSQGVGTPAQVIVGAPTKNNFSLVSTPDRHLVCLGTEGTIGDPNSFDPMFVRFSNQEDVNTFVESATNTAGGQRLSDGNRIISGIRSRGQILIFTDNALHGMQYVGPPFTFGFQQLGTNCGLIGPHAAVDVNGIAIWMGPEDFFIFDGTTKKLPCTVQDFVFKNLNLVQSEKVFAGLNALFNEVTWWYPTAQSEYIDRYVTYNYVENTWQIGTMARTAWQDVGVYNRPIGVEYEPDSALPTFTPIYGLTPGRAFVYTQEDGVNADGVPIDAYLKSGYFDIGDGEEVMLMKRFIPDFKRQVGDLTVNLLLRYYPQSDERVGSLDPYIITPDTPKVDTRVRGRQISILIRSNDLDTDWRFGTLRIEIQPDGRR
jgi:hypothetical protein